MPSAPLACPNCGSVGMALFYQVSNVPAHSVLLLSTREEALSYPTGNIELGFCPACGFISNTVFDPALHEYWSEYEATQSCSPTFNVFHENLAKHLVDRYDLHGKEIIEIGCGQGEFLTLLCELGGNHGVGFDPAYRGKQIETMVSDRVTFVKDFYAERYADYHADFVCCKMTLEHIPDTASFVRMVRRSVGERFATTIFFQVPDAVRILREQAFWDIYYEHCSYFSLGSLARLFRLSGFEVLDLWQDYGDQYLMIESRPARGEEVPPLAQENDLDELVHDVAAFSTACRERLNAWKHDLRSMRQNGRRVVLWGGGSKAVAFLTTLGIHDEIRYVVDINPKKHGTYLAGTAQEVVPPGFLREYQPDVVFVMNPVYCGEIQRDLDFMGLGADLVPV